MTYICHHQVKRHPALLLRDRDEQDLALHQLPDHGQDSRGAGRFPDASPSQPGTVMGRSAGRGIESAQFNMEPPGQAEAEKPNKQSLSPLL